MIYTVCEKIYLSRRPVKGKTVFDYRWPLIDLLILIIHSCKVILIDYMVRFTQLLKNIGGQNERANSNYHSSGLFSICGAKFFFLYQGTFILQKAA